MRGALQKFLQLLKLSPGHSGDRLPKFWRRRKAPARSKKNGAALATASESAPNGRPHLPQAADDSLALQDFKHGREEFESDRDGLYSEIPLPAEEDEMDPSEREKHEGFMREALFQAEYALNHDETPVGCVFVHDGQVIGRGMNDTNRSLNGTRHAEFVAIATILQEFPKSVFKETDLYVTVEPCIMCASALRQIGIRRVFFGCANDRFGGTGGVLSIHRDRSIDPPYPAIGGIFREEAIMLLRRFYIQENAKAPVPHKKNRVLKEGIPPMQQPKSSFPSQSPLKTINASVEYGQTTSKIATPMPKIVPAVPILKIKPRANVSAEAA